MWVSCPVRARGRPARFIFGRRKRGDQLFTGFSQLTILIIINQHCQLLCKLENHVQIRQILDFLKFEENDLSMCCMLYLQGVLDIFAQLLPLALKRLLGH